MDHLAHALNVSGEALREANLYREGQTTPYGDVLVSCHLEKLWRQLKESSDYERRYAEIEAFNQVRGEKMARVSNESLSVRI